MTKLISPSNISGIFAVHKPKGYTSTNIVSFGKKLLGWYNVHSQLPTRDQVHLPHKHLDEAISTEPRVKLKVQQPQRQSSGKVRIGHGGTLDPLATGVLVIGLGREYTKALHDFLNGPKTYVAKAQLGAATTTYDSSGLPFSLTKPFCPDDRIHLNPFHLNIQPEHRVTRDRLEQALQSMLGQKPQIPPLFSALKVNGSRMYTIARKLERDHSQLQHVVKALQTDDYTSLSHVLPLIKVREVSIGSIRLLYYDEAKGEFSFELTCGAGTYVRSVIHDVGRKLAIGAYMTELQRTQQGPFRLSDCVTLEDAYNNEGWLRALEKGRQQHEAWRARTS
jgi:tRNA pseudouridine55 synthase